jgi:DNA repair photolyase
MRWDQQRVENDQRLPGIGDGTVVRTFDAPGAMGINFHEVRAKSALNRVPGGSFGFGWTINPYRGCTHACVFCLRGETPILMADGSTRPLADVRIGDAIYGTVRRGVYRRYEVTRVLAHWTTRKIAYRIVLENGTELVASGDHRFLTDRGWKYVTGTENGRDRRPHLTLNDKLMGVGDLGVSVEESAEYRRGYLCGVIRGDGSVDSEALQRTRDYLLGVGVLTDEFQLLKGNEHHRPMAAIRTSSRSSVDRIRELIRWPDSSSEEWSRGFLAGIFDAEGSCSGSLGIANKDQEIIDPAISRKRSIAGIAIKSQAKLGIVAIEPLGRRIRMFDITTGTGDFIANGVVSHNCFARKTHTYLDLNAGRDFEREIVVKVNVPEVLRAELARPSWKRELVALGTNTDPYQWVESRYRMMPEILAALEQAETPVSVLTKSPLAIRDIEIYARMAKHLPVSVNLSVPTLDEKAWRATEPHTPSPSARLDAVAELRKRGIDSGVLIAPLMPGINDTPEQVQPIVDRAKAAGATFLGGVVLHLRGEVKDVFLAWLKAKRPDLIPKYEQLYPDDRAYLPASERTRVSSVVRGWGRGSRSAREERRSPQLADTQSRRRSGGDLSEEGTAVPPPQGKLF